MGPIVFDPRKFKTTHQHVNSSSNVFLIYWDVAYISILRIFCFYFSFVKFLKFLRIYNFKLTDNKISSTILMSGSVEHLGKFGFPKWWDMKNNMFLRCFPMFLVFVSIFTWKKSKKVQMWGTFWKFQKSSKTYWNRSGIIN